MKTLALTSTVISLSAATLFGQTQSDIEFLRARADAHESKISQLEQEISRLRSMLAEKSTAATAAPQTKAPKAIPVDENGTAAATYVVRQGDILTRIAQRHQTSVAAIMKANGLTGDHITVGQKLRIPGASTPVAPAPVSAPAPAPKQTVARHQVQSGETFYSIARDYKVSVSSLMAANPDVEPMRLYVGQTLVIDGNAKAANTAAPKSVARTTEAASKAPAPAKSAPAAKTGPEPEIRTITVNEQITYGQFASRYGASTTQLNALNGLSLSKGTMLAKGSELYVPKY